MFAEITLKCECKVTQNCRVEHPELKFSNWVWNLSNSSNARWNFCCERKPHNLDTQHIQRYQLMYDWSRGLSKRTTKPGSWNGKMTGHILAKHGLNSFKGFLYISSCLGVTWQNKGLCAKSLKKSTWLSYNLAFLWNQPMKQLLLSGRCHNIIMPWRSKKT